MQRTPIYQLHLDAGAKMVPFCGWEMPIHYGSQINEHKVVREQAGMFDVSHMNVVDVKGTQAGDFLRYLLANDVAKLTEKGRALYSCLLNHDGGILDDLIVYYLDDDFYRVVLNAATREKDLAWINQQAGDFDVVISERPEFAMVAIQGPKAREMVADIWPQQIRQQVNELKVFRAVAHDGWLIARTGYTGEDGLEVILPQQQATQFWQQLQELGVQPCGLGARDTLRLEAGLNLYGSDMDESNNPFESNLSWTVAFEPADRDFIGRKALESLQQKGVERQFVGLILEQRGVLRGGMPVVVEGLDDGVTTSGTFSPSLGFAIALARIPKTTVTQCQVAVRNKLLPARIVKPSFVRQGKPVFE